MNLRVIEKLTKTYQDKEGRTYEVPVGKQIVTNLECSEYDIKGIREILTNRGIVLRTQCLITHPSYGNLIVKENIKHLTERINKLKKDNIVIVKGFQQNK